MKTLIIILFFMLFASTMVAQVSDDFLIGCYSYMKAWPNYSAFHDSIIGYLRNANYNGTMFETNDPDVSYTNDLINRLSAQGIGSYLCDYHWDQDMGTGDITSGTYAISTGNRWKFEVEYNSDNPNHPNEDTFFYRFNDPGRTGSYSLDGIRDVWRCNAEGVSADTPGVALHGLRYRWRNYDPGYDATSWEGEYSFGGEFKFASWGEGSPQTISYLQNNKLYLKYLIRVADGTSTSPELSFACKFLSKTLDVHGDPVWSWVWIPLKNVLTASSPADSIVYSCADMRSDLYTTSENDVPNSLYHYLTFEVDFSDLQSNNCISWTNYWYSTLYGIDPYVRWFGGHTVYLDNVEIKDKMYDTLESQPATVSSWMSGRLFSDAARHYTLDEPSQPQFKSLQQLNGGNEVPGILSTTKAIPTINSHGHRMKKPDGTRYSHPALYIDIAGPSELLVDYYALNPQDNWNIAAMQDTISGEIPTLKNTMQWNLDWGALQHYRKLRKDTLYPNPNRKLYVVPPTFGRWYPIANKWTTYQYPTPKMAKCLQLLPLCFGVEGVFNYYLYNPIAIPSNPSIIPWPNELEFDPLDEYNREARYIPNQYSLLDVTNHATDSFVITQTPQYLEICDANAKLHTYGNIIHNADNHLTWMDSATIGRTGLFLSPDAYEDESIAATNWDMYLNSLFVQSSTAGLYSGYVQCGFYEDTYNRPWYMLVNRRTDYSNSPSGTLENIHVAALRDGTGYTEALPQVVSFNANQVSADTFGSCTGLYDPFDGSVYSQTELGINVPIGPGDGKLLQMCSTLPATVNSDATLKTLAHITGNITIDDSAFVNILPGTETWIQNNSVITVKGGSRLKMSGTVCIGDNVEIIAEEGGILEIDASNCEWGCDARVTIDGGCFTVGSGSMSFGDGSSINAVANSTVILDSVTCSMGSGSILECYDSNLQIVNSTIGTVAGVVWNGLRAECGTVVLDNSTISNAESNRMSDVSLISENCIFNVPENSLGLYLSCYSSNNSSVITATQEGKGFFGEPSTQGEYNTGIEICYPSNYTGHTLVKNIEFHNLWWGFKNDFDEAVSDTLKYCTFVECQIGIELRGTSYNPWILASDFISCQKGILLEATSPRIHDCDFDTCQIGILAESTVSPEGEVRRCEFLYNGNNINPPVGIESRGSNIRIANNDFYDIHTAILCHAGSNLNLGNNAKNKLKADSYNIRFLDNAANYRSTIQVYTGHNDFYHTDPGLTITKDYSFDENYYVVVPPKSRAFDGSYNWYGNSVARIECPSPYPDSYVKVLYYDPEPNVPIFPEEERMAVALGFENENQHENAKLLYKAILDEDLDAESKFLLEAIDGFYRTSHKLETPSEVVETYLQSKIVQYEAVDYNVVSFLKDYLVKQYLSKKDFQAAIDVIQARLDNPSSPIDSVLAVLDLEIVFMLYDMEDSKAPIRSKYTQYKYPTKAAYRIKHNEHWDLLKELSGQETTSEIPIPPVATISRNYPNPFNPSTTIEYSIPAASNVRLSIYNIKGQRVAELVNADLQKGHHKVVWNGKDSQNRNVSTGIYLIRMEANGKRATHKTMLMK